MAAIAKQPGRSYSIDYRVGTGDGEWRWVGNRSESAEVDEAGRPVRISGISIDITAQKAAEQELAALNAELESRVAERSARLQQSREHLRLILRHLPVVIWASLDDGRFGRTYVSETVRGVLGYEPEQFTADAAFWIERIHPEDRPGLIGRLPREFAAGSWAHQYRFRHADGTWRWLHAEGRTLPQVHGEPREIAGYWIDITERKNAEQALARAHRMQSTFMNNVTHELRTPLHSVIGFAELLKDEVPGSLNGKQRAFARDIHAAGRHLLALVEGILEMTRLDVAENAPQRAPLDAAGAVAERIAAHRQAAEARGVAIAAELAPGTGDIHVDAAAFRRMLDALIGNAIKFNREGGAVAVRVRRARETLEIAVADTGIGISKEDLPRLFQPLVQLDGALARRYGGIGLGLALARRLAGLHGGTIDVESETGKGSTFTLRLPAGEQS